jgi:hypothetical protein
MAPLLAEQQQDGAANSRQASAAYADSLARAVDSLSSGLVTFDDSTKQMEVICSSFQERLGQLEVEMRPMKMISNKLSAARRHVLEAVEEMEKVS